MLCIEKRLLFPYLLSWSLDVRISRKAECIRYLNGSFSHFFHDFCCCSFIYMTTRQTGTESHEMNNNNNKWGRGWGGGYELNKNCSKIPQ